MLIREPAPDPARQGLAARSSSPPPPAYGAAAPGPDALLRLQRTIGNQAMQRLLRASEARPAVGLPPARAAGSNVQVREQPVATPVQRDCTDCDETQLHREVARDGDGGALDHEPPAADATRGEPPLSVDVRTHVDRSTVQRQFPGDGMLPPGDCGWADYLVLRGSVETAKAVVSTLGACAAGDSCIFLATKIAAITAEIAARVALDTTCFKGGDAGHRQQVQDKINMMNRCYRFFQNANCSPELIAAMAVVVEQARAVIAAAAIVVALAVVAALIAAIIALVEAIAAAAAAAAAAVAEGAAIAAAVASLGALLALIVGQLSAGPGTPDAA